MSSFRISEEEAIPYPPSPEETSPKGQQPPEDAGEPATPCRGFRKAQLSSTPYPSHPKSRSSRFSRQTSKFPTLIPGELVLGLLRETSAVAAAAATEEQQLLTCGTSNINSKGKEDPAAAAVSSRRTTAPSSTSTFRRAAHGTNAGAQPNSNASMGACTSKKAAQKPKVPEKPVFVPEPAVLEPVEPVEPDDANDEEEPGELPKFMLKRDSIAVTKVRMLKTQINQENTIGEEEETDEQEHEVSERGEERVHFDSHVSKQSIPNDSGVSLNSCPESDCDKSMTKFGWRLECDSPDEVSLAANVTIRSMRKVIPAEDEIAFCRSCDFKTLRERTRHLLESQMKKRTPPPIVPRTRTTKTRLTN